MRLLNDQDKCKAVSIESKVKYAILGWNNTTHSVTNLRPNEIITDHIENNILLDLNI